MIIYYTIANYKLPNTCHQAQLGHLNPAQALTRAWDPQPSICAPRGLLFPPSPSRRSENTPIADLDLPGSIDFANSSFSDSFNIRFFLLGMILFLIHWQIGDRLMWMLWMVVGNWKSPSMEEFVIAVIVPNQLGLITSLVWGGVIYSKLSFLHRFLFWGSVRD